MNTLTQLDPSATESAEDWKYTNLSLVNFSIFQPAKSDKVNPSSIQIDPSWLIQPISPLQWIYYNGISIRKPFNLMLQDEEGTIRLAKNSCLDEPLYFIHILEANAEPLMIHPTTIILAEENSKATIIELYLSLGLEPSFSKVNTQIKLAKGSKIEHVFVQRSASKSLQIANIHIQQFSESHYIGNAIQAGGDINRTAFNVELCESHTTCEFYSVELAKKNQQMDLQLSIQHQAPHTTSQTVSRAIVKDKAKCAFTGKIYVPKNASNTKAMLENKNLLLSPYAEANTRPQLYIDTNDIECTHGATVGNLDLDALFYLRSRGLTKEAAEDLLIQSFIAPSLQGLPSCTVSFLDDLLHEK